MSTPPPVPPASWASGSFSRSPAGGRPAWLLPVAGVCGCLALLAIAACVGFGWLGWTVFENSEKVGIRVELPEDVRVGDEIEVVAVVTNHHGEEPITITSVDVAQSLLAGFASRGIDPPARSATEMFGTLSQVYDLEVPPGAEQRFVMRWRAAQAGSFAGDIDVHGPMFVATFTTHVIVEEPVPGAPAGP